MARLAAAQASLAAMALGRPRASAACDMIVGPATDTVHARRSNCCAGSRIGIDMLAVPERVVLALADVIRRRADSVAADLLRAGGTRRRPTGRSVVVTTSLPLDPGGGGMSTLSHRIAHTCESSDRRATAREARHIPSPCDARDMDECIDGRVARSRRSFWR
jgi:hypothetical protein